MLLKKQSPSACIFACLLFLHLSSCGPEDHQNANSSLSSLETVATEFRVLTYNVQMRPVLDNNTYKAQRISPKLNIYDIASVQESFSHKSDLMAFARHPFKEHFMDKRHILSLADSGLSTLSRFPIVYTKKEHYKSYAGLSDSVASKGILLTRIDINGHIVDVYNTHMQAGDHDKEQNARFHQATQLAKFINANSPTTHSVLMIGDFNMGPLRPGKPFADYSPQNYSNERDMIIRTNIFQLLIDHLGLSDMEDSLSEVKLDDIERMYFRSACGSILKPLSFRKDFDRFVDEHSKPLSDSTPLTALFSIQKTKENCTQQVLIPEVPKANEVRFYKNCYHNGPWISLEVGQDLNLASTIIMDDQISSVKQGPGLRTVLAENADGSGKKVCVKEGSACLRREPLYRSVADRVSYIRVYSLEDPELPELCR